MRECVDDDAGADAGDANGCEQWEDDAIEMVVHGATLSKWC